MKKFLLILIITVSFGMVSQANALMIGDANYVGFISPDGGNPTEELGHVNTLIGLDPGQVSIVIGSDTYNRVGSTLSGLPTAEPGEKQDNGSTTFLPDNLEYILGKYDQTAAGALVWYLSDGSSAGVTLPDTFNGHALSHSIGFNATGGTTPGGDPVPEPTTILMVGIGLLGVAFAGRKKLRK